MLTLVGYRVLSSVGVTLFIKKKERKIEEKMGHAHAADTVAVANSKRSSLAHYNEYRISDVVRAIDESAATAKTKMIMLVAGRINAYFMANCIFVYSRL